MYILWSIFQFRVLANLNIFLSVQVYDGSQKPLNKKGLLENYGRYKNCFHFYYWMWDNPFIFYAVFITLWNVFEGMIVNYLRTSKELWWRKLYIVIYQLPLAAITYISFSRYCRLNFFSNMILICSQCWHVYGKSSLRYFIFSSLT